MGPVGGESRLTFGPGAGAGAACGEEGRKRAGLPPGSPWASWRRRWRSPKWARGAGAGARGGAERGRSARRVSRRGRGRGRGRGARGSWGARAHAARVPVPLTKLRWSSRGGHRVCVCLHRAPPCTPSPVSTGHRSRGGGLQGRVGGRRGVASPWESSFPIYPPRLSSPSRSRGCKRPPPKKRLRGGTWRPNCPPACRGPDPGRRPRTLAHPSLIICLGAPRARPAPQDR